MKAKILISKLAFAGMALGMFTGIASAAGGGALPFDYKADVSNLPSVQRGARIFMNNCSGCHSMKFMRYSRIAQDLNIPEEMMQKNLMFTSDKMGDQIHAAMPAADGAKWFGQAPPDLSLETRFRGEDWVYSYLKSFYLDPARPMGVNNTVLPGASMPNVLWEKQGWQVQAHHDEDAGHEGGHGKPAPFELVSEGSMSPDDFDKYVGDLVNFMAYAAEPGRSMRQSVGIKALFYLLLLTIFAYFLKKEFWKDIH